MFGSRKKQNSIKFQRLNRITGASQSRPFAKPKRVEREIDSINTKLQNLEHSKIDPFIEICELLGSVCYHMQNYSDERVPQILVDYILSGLARLR